MCLVCYYLLSWEVLLALALFDAEFISVWKEALFGFVWLLVYSVNSLSASKKTALYRGSSWKFVRYHIPKTISFPVNSKPWCRSRRCMG